jgi:hypothetical protein
VFGVAAAPPAERWLVLEEADAGRDLDDDRRHAAVEHR